MYKILTYLTKDRFNPVDLVAVYIATEMLIAGNIALALSVIISGPIITSALELLKVTFS